MPAAAVIPAPVAYAKVVAVEKLVAEAWGWTAGSAGMVCTSRPSLPSGFAWWVPQGVRRSTGSGSFTVNKTTRSRQAVICLECCSMG